MARRNRGRVTTPPKQVGVQLTAPEQSVVVRDHIVEEAIRLLDCRGVAQVIEEWADADAAGAGGRPETFPTRSLLVAMFLAAMLGRPMWAKTWHQILCFSLSPKMKRELQVEDLDPGKAGYRNVRTRFHKIERLIDFSPNPKNRCLPPVDFESRVAARKLELTDERAAELRGRQEWLVNELIRIGHQLMPAELWGHWTGGMAVDATPVETFSRGPKRARPTGGKKPQIIEHPADPDGGWYVREGDHADTGASGQSKYLYGYEHTLVFMAPTSRPESGLYPNLLLAMAVPHVPGESPGRNGFAAVRLANEAAVTAGGSPSLVCGDNAYVNALPADFAVPIRALGLDPVFDYNKTQAGRQGHHDGALLVDGAWYCPAMPEALIEATNDFRRGAIDEQSYRRRIHDRRAFALRPKAHAEADGSIRMMCPAAGVARTMRCDLKPRSLEPKHRGKRRVDLNHLLRNEPPKICRQQSITIPAAARGRFEQGLAYGTEEWRSAYQTMRSTNEGGNGTAKNAGDQDIQSAGRRRIRGQAANALITCFQYAAYNLQAIRSFISKAVPDSTGKKRITRYPRSKRPAQRETPPSGLATHAQPTSTSDPPEADRLRDR